MWEEGGKAGKRTRKAILQRVEFELSLEGSQKKKKNNPKVEEGGHSRHGERGQRVQGQRGLRWSAV